MASAGKGGVISGYTRNLACLTIIGSNIVATVESTASQIGHINLNMKRTGKPGAGKPHAGFDEAGAGNGLLSTAPVLDPTLEGKGAVRPLTYSVYYEKIHSFVIPLRRNVPDMRSSFLRQDSAWHDT